MELALHQGGTEIPGWRKLLQEEGVIHVSLSYIGLRRRIKNTSKWLLADKYQPQTRIFLDSGAYSVNKNPQEYGEYYANQLAKDYLEFVRLNADRIDFYSEFDAMILGEERLTQMRNEMTFAVAPEKLMVVWHPETGIEELERLSLTYHRIGIPRVALGERDLIPFLNRLAKNGAKLHGIAMTKPDIMREVQWSSVSSMSWLSPAQFGDTICWDGKEMRRTPTAGKEDFRKRMRTHFTNAGFDAEKIEADDSKELLRLSIWSWKQLTEDINRHRGHVLTTSPETATGQNTETEGGEVGKTEVEMRNFMRQIEPRDPSEMRTIPGLNLVSATETFVDTDGVNKTREVSLVGTQGGSQRACNTCFLAAKCPAFREGAACGYNIPIVIKTRDQFQALQSALIEMQTQRVLFMKLVEDQEGGYVDTNLSSEIDRLQRLMKTKNDMDQEGFTLTLRAQQGASGQTGLIGRLFGGEASETARALPAPLPADDVLRDLGAGIIDVEVVDN